MKEWNSLWGAEPLYLAPKYQSLLLELLHRYVPDQAVWAFGSRATGRYLGRFSDLDLAVEERLSPGVRSELLDALDASDFPVKVDLVELAAVDPAFAARIRPDFVPVQVAAPAPSTHPAGNRA